MGWPDLPCELLINRVQGQAMVMRAFVDIHSYYIKSDKNNSKRLEIEDVESFTMAQFHEIPEALHVRALCPVCMSLAHTDYRRD